MDEHTRETKTTPEGFEQLTPVPEQEELVEYYAQKYYQEGHGEYQARYDDMEVRYIEAMVRRKAEAVRRYVPELPERGSLLDVGCGEGYALALFHRDGWDVTGIDFSSEGVARHHPDLLAHIRQGDVFELVDEAIAGDDRFDLIWLDNVLEHVRDPLDLLARCRRAISAGGALVVEVPNDFSIVQRDLVRLGLIEDRSWVFVPDHLSYFSRPSLARLAAVGGWRERGTIGDFPIDWFLYHPDSNYYRDPTAGRDAHRARMRLELLMENQDRDRLFQFLEALADVGFGRQIISIFS